MIEGSVSGLRALVSVPLRLPNQPGIEIEFEIDTGFLGFLAMPPVAITALSLPFVRAIPANLANDTTILVHVFALTILWHGEEQEVEVLATGRRPLLGTALLNGSRIEADFREDGPVVIKPLP